VSNFAHTPVPDRHSFNPALRRTSRCTDRPQLEASMPSENRLRATRKSLPEIWFVLIRLKLAGGDLLCIGDGEPGRGGVSRSVTTSKTSGRYSAPIDARPADAGRADGPLGHGDQDYGMKPRPSGLMRTSRAGATRGAYSITSRQNPTPAAVAAFRVAAAGQVGRKSPGPFGLIAKARAGTRMRLVSQTASRSNPTPTTATRS
jgi:hypothetical protein